MIDPLRFVATTPAPLVGRTALLSMIDQLIRRIESGEQGPRTLLISGEAGIGKSRLLAALAERVGPAWHVFEAACFEPYQSEPYAPLIDMLPRALHGAADQPGGILPPTASALAMLPGLENLAPPGDAEPAHDAPQNQRRLFQALNDLFTRLAGQGPLLISIEDIHWSDAATLAFLPILAHALAGCPALLVLTYRADEVDPALATALAALDRRRLAVEVFLSRLSRGEVATLLQALVGLEQAVPAALLDTLYELTDGNPFFVEEVVTAMLVSGTIDTTSGAWLERPIADLPIPRSVQEAVTRRSARLSPTAHQLLLLAAALGRRFDFAILQRATGRGEAELLALLKELIAARLLVEETPDQFAFRHALGRAAIYGGLLARERRGLHRQLAEALELTSADTHAAALAQHFLQAGGWEKALHYARSAADQARRLHAQREVIAHLTTALKAAANLRNTPRAELLIARANAFQFLGEFDAARADLEAALADAQNLARREDEWRSLLSLGELWTARDYHLAGEYFTRTLEYARAAGDPALLARALIHIGNWHMNQERPQTACAMHEEALAIFESLDDLSGQAASLEVLGLSRFFTADILNGVETLTLAGQRALAAHDDLGWNRALARKELRCFASNEVLDVESLSSAMESVERVFHNFRQVDWRSYEAAILQVIGGNMIQVGEFGKAQACLQNSAIISREIGYHEWHAYSLSWLAALALELHNPADAVRQAEQAMAVAQATRSPMILREVGYQLVRAYTAQAAFAEAETALAAALRPTSQQNETSLMLRRVQLAGAELALARGEPERGLAEVEALIASAKNPAGRVIPALWYVRGQGLLALRRYDQARLALEEAHKGALAEDRLPIVYRALVALAQLAIAQRRNDAAETLLHEARRMIDALAARLDVADGREQFRRRALATLPSPPSVTPRQAVKQVFGGLTDRELDVARLIARGYTNRQIAEALVLSERTVATHIHHILSKLDFSSRAQIARWVSEKGIAP